MAPRIHKSNQIAAAKTGHSHLGRGKAQCLKIFRRLSAYLDGELPANLCEELRRHLTGCDNCEAFLASFKRSIELGRRYPVRPLVSASKSAIREAIRRAARAAS
ncbi:MAG: zf-HC2 domain-containing protein [Nitrospirota bacterium]